MIALLATLLRSILHAFRSTRNILTENALRKKENEILARKMGKKRVHFDFYDKLFLVVLHRAADIKYRLTLVKPETLLAWPRTLLKRFWTFQHRPAQRGRKPVDTEIKDLILSMKNDGYLSEDNDYPQDSSGLQAERQDSEVTNLEEVSNSKYSRVNL
jgi:hypothetical protein